MADPAADLVGDVNDHVPSLNQVEEELNALNLCGGVPNGGNGQPLFQSDGPGFVADPGTQQTQGQLPVITADLNALAHALGVTIYGISGYRSPAHSVAVGGSANDPHTKGEAEDIGVDSLLRSSAARVAAKPNWRSSGSTGRSIPRTIPTTPRSTTCSCCRPAARCHSGRRSLRLLSTRLVDPLATPVEQDRPRVDRLDLQMRIAPRILGERRADRVLGFGLDDVHHSLSVSQWAAEDDEASIDKGIHECGMFGPA